LPKLQPIRILIKTKYGGQVASYPVEDEEIIKRLEEELILKVLGKSGQWHLTEFEKDDPKNFHI
jgi:hypothetical protein